MLTIIITNNNKENINDINKYIQHINNINKNIDLTIQILIINNNWKWNISNLKENININNITNLNIKLFNYNSEYNDSIHNEILKNCLYDIILYTTLDTYLTEPILEYISLNKIKDNSYIRTNIIELNEIPIEFFENYTNDVFNKISDKLKYIYNENGKQELIKDNYIKEFNNNNNNIINISNENIIQHNFHYLNNSSDFLLLSKKNLQNLGFNINNTNIQYTFQYLILNLIKNKYNMIKLPILLSVFKKYTNTTLYILNSNINFNSSSEYNTHINYKIYNIIEQKEQNYIRSHIKQLTGIHSNDLAKINKKLVDENEILIKKNEFYLKKIDEYKNEISEINKLKEILQNKNIYLEENFEKICNENKIIKNKYIEKLSIINSNINEIIIDEKKKIFE